MNRNSQYKWLIIVEGNTDKRTYDDLLRCFGVGEGDFLIFPAKGKGYVCNCSTWCTVRLCNASLLNTVANDSGRRGFFGIILVVDSDAENGQAFDSYQRSSDARIRYIEASVPPKEDKGGYWYLDSLDGTQQEIPIYGITVPMSGSGCLETDLLSSYGFPVEGQDAYTQFENIIHDTSRNWQIQKHGDGKEWWEKNRKAKLDKFIYSALVHGFKVSGETPVLPKEPDVISNIKRVIGIS